MCDSRLRPVLTWCERRGRLRFERAAQFGLGAFARQAGAQLNALGPVPEQDAPRGRPQIGAREKPIELAQLGACGEFVAAGTEFIFAAKALGARGVRTPQQFPRPVRALARRRVAPQGPARLETLHL